MPILTAPAWTSGDLLSASKLNAMSDSINALKGLSMAPTGMFVRAADTATYWSRRAYRYLHIRYDFGASGTFRIRINNVEVYAGGTTGEQWRTFDLSAVSTPPEVGAFYKIEMIRPSGGTLMIYEMFESGGATYNATGTYTTPAAWTGSETAAQTLTKLQNLSMAITQMRPVVTPPSATLLWTQTTRTYVLRRRLRYIQLYYVSFDREGDPAGVQVRVNGVPVFADSSDRPDGHTVYLDMNSFASPPAIGAAYTLEFVISGSVTLRLLREDPAYPSATSAALFAHGQTAPNAATLNTLTTTINEAQAILSTIGKSAPCIERPYNHPEWGMWRTARYLHYLREGSLPAYIWEPSGIQEQVSLPKTDNEEWATLDLDTIDWLAPGGTFYIYEADAVWLDDIP